METSQPPPSDSVALPIECPLCGQPMEKGAFVVTGGRIANSIYWAEERQLGPGGEPPPVFPPENILVFRRFLPTGFSGQRCRACKLVIGQYPGWPPPK